MRPDLYFDKEGYTKDLPVYGFITVVLDKVITWNPAYRLTKGRVNRAIEHVSDCEIYRPSDENYREVTLAVLDFLNITKAEMVAEILRDMAQFIDYYHDRVR